MALKNLDGMDETWLEMLNSLDIIRVEVDISPLASDSGQ